MSERRDWRERRAQFVSWVNGEHEPKDRTLFIMEKRQAVRRRPTDEEHEQREKHRLRRFLNWYPIAAGVICLAIVGTLMAAVMTMPVFGDPDNPTNNEVAEHYLEYSEEETGAANVVTGMILSYRGFDTLGESCVLFLAMACVLMLLRRDGSEEDDREALKQRQEDEIGRRCPDGILRQAARVLVPFVFLFAVYVLVNGEESPGGGFSGGTILGCGLVLFSSAFGPEETRRFFSARTYAGVRTFGLLVYAALYGYYIFMGANGLSTGYSFTMLIDLAVGLVVACTVYGFYAMFARGEI